MFPLNGESTEIVNGSETVLMGPPLGPSNCTPAPKLEVAPNVLTIDATSAAERIHRRNFIIKPFFKLIEGRDSLINRGSLRLEDVTTGARRGQEISIHNCPDYDLFNDESIGSVD